MPLYGQFDVAMPRDRKMIAAGWQGRAVYFEATLYCRENLTNGIIERAALICWMPDMPVKTRTKHLDRLAEVGALELVEEGWRIPDAVWRRWNPTKEQVEEKRRQEADRKAEYRSRRQMSQESPNGTETDVRAPRRGVPDSHSHSHSQTQSHSQKQSERSLRNDDEGDSGWPPRNESVIRNLFMSIDEAV